MQIVQVDLSNFKSYQDQSISFTPGTNAISGKNGAGKSSILEAIGFALFGYTPYSQKQLVREGEKTGSVTVHIIGKDEKLYQITRKCGSSTQQYVYDPELDQKIVNGVSDTDSWLKNYLSLGIEVDLSSIFRDAVGVPQGQLTSVFLEPASKRKITFNPLLGVDEYEQVWKKLIEPQNYIKEKVLFQVAAISGFDGQLQALPDLIDSKKDLEKQLFTAKCSLEEKQAKLENVRNDKNALEKLKQEFDAKGHEINTQKIELKNVKENLSKKKEDLLEAEAAKERVELAKPGYDIYLKGQVRLEELDKQREKRDKLERDKSGHESDLQLFNQKFEQKQNELSKILDAENALLEIEPKVKREAFLKNKLTENEDIIREMDKLVYKCKQIQQEIGEYQTKLDKLQSEIDLKIQKEESLRISKEGREKQQNDKQEIVEKISNAKAKREQIQAKITALGEASAICPICEEPLTKDHQSELIAKFKNQVSDLKNELEQMHKDKKELEQQIVQKEQEIVAIEKSIDALPRERELEDLANLIKDKKQDLYDLGGAKDELEVAIKKKDELTQKIKELNEPSAEKKSLNLIVEGKDEVEFAIKELEEKIEEKGQIIKTLDGDLKQYQSLDKELAVTRSAVNDNKQDHDVYMRNFQLAESLIGLEEEVEELENEKKEKSNSLAEQQRIYSDLENNYDEKQYKQLKEDYENLQREEAKEEKNIEHLDEGIKKADENIQRLEAILEEKQEAEQKKEALEELQELLAFIRTTLREAGPEITKRLVGMISMEAEGIYRDMMQDYRSRLQWTEDYDIQLITDGQTRHFPQLSGGEGMAAALAVRLALVREISGFDIAFFDEPTANLDEQRRDNLSEQIMNIRGFSQIFVISHDDTFEKDTDHMIRIVKENNTSRVEI